MSDAEFTARLLILLPKARALASCTTANKADGEDAALKAAAQWWSAIQRNIPYAENDGFYFNLVYWRALEIAINRQRRSRQDAASHVEDANEKALGPVESVRDQKAHAGSRVIDLKFLLEKFCEAVSPEDYDRWWDHYALGYEIKEIAQNRVEKHEFVKSRVRRAEEKWREIVERYGAP